MRKSVMILIGIIFIIAIVIVNFFGLKITNNYVKIFVERVEILETANILQREETNDLTGEVSFVKYLEVDLSSKNYQLEWRVLPSLASDNKVNFIYDKESTVASVNEHGLITFYRAGIIDITISANDGSNKSDKITVIVK